MRISNTPLMVQQTARFVVLLAGLSLVPFAPAQTPPAPSSNAALMTAITGHGGNALRGVARLRIEGQSASPRGTTRVVISADLNGNSRVDYGNPVTRSIINTPSRSIEILNGRARLKPPHAGLFAQLDMLSIFGLMRLETGNITWTDLGPATVAGRAAVSRRADTGQIKQEYQRTLRDQTDITFDSVTGLVSSIARTHYGEKSLDLALPFTYIFSDHRITNNLAFPFRIESYLNRTLVEVITVTNVELNPSFSASIFER